MCIIFQVSLFIGYETAESHSEFPVVFSYFACRGNENNMSSCGSGLRSTTFCTHRQVVRITCEGIPASFCGIFTCTSFF